MSARSLTAQAIQQHCKLLRLPTVGTQFETPAKQAVREKQTPLDYLDTLLSAELEERERRTVERRLREARLPRVKTLEELDFSQTKAVSAPQLTQLAEGGYIERSEPILFLGDCGTGKTHLMTGLCVAACLQKRRVRFTTAAALVNELVEAKQQIELSRVLARWSRYELIAIDEVGHVKLPKTCLSPYQPSPPVSSALVTIRTEKSFAIEVNQVRGCSRAPNFGFPGDVAQIALHRRP